MLVEFNLRDSLSNRGLPRARVPLLPCRQDGADAAAGIFQTRSLYEGGFEALCWIHLWLAELHFVSEGAHLSALLKGVSACLQSVGSVVVSQHCCTVSTPLQLCLHYVSPAAIGQLSCTLSAQLQSICSSVLRHAIHLL